MSDTGNILDSTYLIGTKRIFITENNPSVVPIDPTPEPASESGDLIFWTPGQGLPVVLFAKTANGNTTDVVALTSRDQHAGGRDPVVTDDLTKGYDQFSNWYNEVNDTVWVCIDPTPFAARWKQIA